MLTDSEMREQLTMEFVGSAQWRRQKAQEFPNDDRNLAAATILDQLAVTVADVAPEKIDVFSALFDDLPALECHSELLREVGFQWWPRTASEFIDRYVAKISGAAAA